MDHAEILTQGARAREAALRRAELARARAFVRGLGRPLLVQLALGALGLPALVADYAQRFYTAGGVAPHEKAALVPWIVRVVIALTLLLGFLLARLGPRLFLAAGDEAFLALTALGARARFRHRALQLALVAAPLVWLGVGAVLPLLWNGTAGLFVRGLALWLAWAPVAWAVCAALASLSPRQGRGQGLWELGAALVAPALLWAARLATGPLVPLERPDSLWVTAALGVGLAWAVAHFAARSPGLLAAREAALERGRARAERAPRRRLAARAARPRRRALPRWGRGAWAFVQRNLTVARRSPRVGGPWAGSLLLKALGFVTVLAPAAATGGRPWALAGALLLFGDAVAGGALIAQMEYEQPHVFFGAPGPRARRWWGAAAPHLVVSVACALALSAVAFAAPDGGLLTARFLLGWCGLAGASIIVTAANLAMAAFPDVGVAQNLFWIGLLVCMILSSVLPLFGWIILFAFALVSFRQLRHWGPSCALAAAFALGALAAPGPAHGQVGPAAPGDTIHVQRGPARQQPTFVQVTTLDDSLYVLSAGTANVTACLTDSGWVLVDAGTRAEAAAIRERLRRIADRRFALVVDTHVHDDHAGGNALYLGMGVPVLATARAREEARTYATRMARGAPREIARLAACEAALPAGPETARQRGFYDFMQQWWSEGADEARHDPHALAPPSVAFRGRAARGAGTRRLEARALPPAHTGGDCVVLFPAQRVAVVGDVFARGSIPAADQFMMDGSMEGVLAAQDSLLAWIPDDTTGGGWRIVPGHGPIARRADLAADRRALGELRTCLRQAYDLGRAPATMGEDCLGAGFAADRGDYAAWLFAEDWAHGARRPPVRRPAGDRARGRSRETRRGPATGGLFRNS